MKDINSIRRKEDNRSEIKQRIIDVATKAFCEKGLRQVKMDDIASSVSVSKRTIYELFCDKEQLLLEIVKRHEEETAEYLARKREESENVLEVFFAIFNRISDEIEKTNVLFFHELNKYPLVVDFLNKRKENTAGMAYEGFMKGVAQGLLRSDFNFEIIRTFIVEEMNLILKSNLIEKYPPYVLHESLFFMHLRGIATQKGIAMIDEFMEDSKKRRMRKDS